MVKVSVVVPIYKIKQEYLEKCIESVTCQTLKDIQIILVDDGSPDHCGQVCDSYAEKDDRILVIHQANQGVSVARNAGIEKSIGEYVLFVDGDDYLANDACEKLYERMKESDDDILLYGHKCVNENEEVSHLLGRDIVFDKEGIVELQKVILNPSGELLKIAPAGTVGKMYKRSFINENQLRYIPGIRRMQDNLFCLYGYQFAKKISYYDYPGYYYRINGDSVCQKFNPQIFEIMEEALVEFDKFIQRYAPELRPYYYCKVISILCGEYMRIYFRHPDNHKRKKEIKRELKDLIINERNREALDKVNFKNLPTRIKVIAFFLEHKLVNSLWFLLDCEKRIRISKWKVDRI